MNRPRLDAKQKRELTERNVRSFEVEAQQEMARALARAVEKLALAAEAAHEAVRALEGLHGEARAAALLHAREHKKRADRAQWELKVHREALGLTRHAEVFDAYPIPRVPRE